MNVSGMVIGGSVSESEPHTVYDVQVDFAADIIGVLVEIEDCKPGFLYMRLVDDDGHQVLRSTNYVLPGRVPYLQIPWIATMPGVGSYAVECRWESGRLLKRRYIRREPS